jgi:hypothetical protein
MRPCWISVWARLPPVDLSSRPASPLSFRPLARGHLRSALSCSTSPCQRVLETTYLGGYSAFWRPRLVGDLRPVRGHDLVRDSPEQKGVGGFNQSVTNRPVASSAYGTIQPPCLNPSLRPPWPPGPCKTPSRDRNVVKVTCTLLSFNLMSLARRHAYQCRHRISGKVAQRRSARPGRRPEKGQFSSPPGRPNDAARRGFEPRDQ